MYIGAATKSITNDDTALKNEILLNIFGANGMHEFNKFISNPDFGSKFDHHTDNVFLRNHQILKQLEKGYEREFDPELNLPDVSDKLTTWKEVAMQLNQEVQEQMRVYENSKNNLNAIVDNICTQGLKKRKNEPQDDEKQGNAYPTKRLSERHKSTQGSVSRKQSKMSEIHQTVHRSSNQTFAQLTNQPSVRRNRQQTSYFDLGFAKLPSSNQIKQPSWNFNPSMMIKQESLDKVEDNMMLRMSNPLFSDRLSRGHSGFMQATNQPSS